MQLTGQKKRSPWLYAGLILGGLLVPGVVAAALTIMWAPSSGGRAEAGRGK